MSRRRRYAFTSACVLTVGVAFLEAGARFGLGLGAPPLSIEHPKIEYMFAPNQNIVRFGNRFQTNAWGMRSPAFPPIKLDRNELRIMVFGDSVVNGGNLTDQSELATSLLQQELMKELERPVNVGNISAGSWGPGNWRAYADEFGFFDADCVILVANSGDIGDCPTFEPLNPNTHPTGAPWCATSALFSRYVPRYLPGLNSPPAKTPAQSFNSAQEVVGLNDLRRFLTAAKFKTSSVHVMQFLGRDELREGHDPPGFHTMSMQCAELGVPTYSTRQWFPVTQVDEHFRDNIHPSPRGQRQLAKAILESIPFSSILLNERSTPEE